MKLIHKQIYELPDFEFFSEELFWPVKTWDDVINILEGFEDLTEVLGFPDEYYEVK